VSVGVLFILVGSIECFIVVDAIEVIVEQRKVDSDLRKRLQGSEANVRHLKSRLAHYSTEEVTIPVDAQTMLGDSDIGAWTWSNGE
jgi:hypothetical protein